VSSAGCLCGQCLISCWQGEGISAIVAGQMKMILNCKPLILDQNAQDYYASRQIHAIRVWICA